VVGREMQKPRSTYETFKNTTVANIHPMVVKQKKHATETPSSAPTETPQKHPPVWITENN
jgi:hypothetical protein